MKKLYRVEVRSEYYVYAEDETEAEALGKRAVKDEHEWDTNAVQVRDRREVPRDYLVYHSEKYDLKAEQAFKKWEEESAAAAMALFVPDKQLKIPGM